MAECASCAGTETAPLFPKSGYRYVACKDCGTGRLDPIPTRSEAAAIYGEAYFRGGGRGGYSDYEADEALHRQNARARLGLVRAAAAPTAGSPLKLADVGCAHGFFLDEAARAGCRVAGVEVSPHARSVASSRFGLEVHASLADLQRQSPGDLDAVTFFQVLEHMSDPLLALSQAARCLRPGGSIVIETWDRGSAVARIFRRHWQQVSPPSVVWLFNRAGLRRMLDRAGFEEVRIRRWAKVVSVGFAASLLADKHPLLRGPLRKLASSPKIAARSVRYSLGDLIAVVGRLKASGGERSA